MWFTETPWPPIFVFGVMAAVLVAVWSAQKRAWPLMGAVALVVLCVLTFVFERFYITDAERVEENILGVAHAFQRKDLEKTLSYFSLQADSLRANVENAMLFVTVENDLDVKDMSVSLVSAGSQAVSRFRANATVSVKGFGNVGFKPSRFEVTWRREGGDWKIVQVDRLDILQDKKIGLLDSSN